MLKSILSSLTTQSSRISGKVFELQKRSSALRAKDDSSFKYTKDDSSLRCAKDDSDFDKKFISYALNLSKKNQNLTAENPVVGCVIVKDDVIISSGVTAAFGRPHAEWVAIDKVSDKKQLVGATLYVTLEPCSHYGKTSPCVDLIIEHKIATVVVAVIDADLRVNGAGVKKLREAGIEVRVGVMAKEAQEINQGFFKVQRSDLPYVTLKLATSLDGKIAAKDRSSKWITNEETRKMAQQLRAQSAAIMIGANTLRYDNPALSCRINGLSAYSPTRIIVANNLNFDLNWQVFQNVETLPTVVITGFNQVDNLQFKQLQDLGIEIITCQKTADGYGIDLVMALQKLAQKGINSVLIEGGRSLATSALKAKLVDEIIWMRSNKIIGDEGISAIAELGVTNIDAVLDDFKLLWVKSVQDDVVAKYKLCS